MVGRDVLVGAAVGTLMVLLYLGGLHVHHALGGRAVLTVPFVQGPTLTSMGEVFFRLFVNQFSAVLFAMVFLFILALLRMLLRHDAPAVVAWLALVAAPIGAEDPRVGWIAGGLRALLIYLVLRRAGLLALASAFVFMFTVIEVPITLDLGAWYLSRALPVVAALLLVAGYAFCVALGGRPMFGSLPLDD
jgi:hypothetical protein